MSRQSFDSEEVSVESEEEDERTTPVEEEGSAEEDAKPISFPLTEEEEVDTTAEQAAAGRDLQGIPWERLQFSREHYRKTRVISYRNYVNVIPDDPVEFRLEYRPELLKLCTPVAYVGNGVQPWQGQEGQLWSKGRPTRPAYFNFVRNNRAVQSNIVHFQLRNLVFAASRNDVFYVHQNSIYHWSPVSRLRTEVLRLSGSGRRSVPRLGRVQVSTMSQMGNLVAAGGFNGELACYRLQNEGELIFAEHITNSENGITNGLELFNSQQHDVCLVASNNDQAVRVYQAMPSGLRLTNRWDYDWAVNYTTAQPGSSVLAVVGDDPVTFLTDMRQRENRVCTLNAHADFSFAAAWHPAGHLLATGNQDTTTCVWDVRQPNSPMARMAGNMGAIRSLRFSADGKFLAASEPADFVHIYDVAADFKRAQLVDLFGEISGISFTPFAEELFIGVADLTYSSVLQYERAPPVQLPTDVPMQWDGVKQEADRQENMAVESEEPEDAETVKFQMMQRSLAAAEEAEDREVQEQEVELQRLIERHADEQEQLLLEEQQPLLQAEPHAGRGQEGAVEQQQQQQQGVDEAGPSGVGHQLNQTINDIQLDQESEDTDEDEEEARFSSWLKDRRYRRQGQQGGT